MQKTPTPLVLRPAASGSPGCPGSAPATPVSLGDTRAPPRGDGHSLIRIRRLPIRRSRIRFVRARGTRAEFGRRGLPHPDGDRRAAAGPSSAAASISRTSQVCIRRTRVREPYPVRTRRAAPEHGAAWPDSAPSGAAATEQLAKPARDRFAVPHNRHGRSDARIRAAALPPSTGTASRRGRAVTDPRRPGRHAAGYSAGPNAPRALLTTAPPPTVVLGTRPAR